MLFSVFNFSLSLAALESKVLNTVVTDPMAKEYATTPSIIKTMQNIRSENVPALTSPYPTVVIVVIVK